MEKHQPPGVFGAVYQGFYFFGGGSRVLLRFSGLFLMFCLVSRVLLRFSRLFQWFKVLRVFEGFATALLRPNHIHSSIHHGPHRCSHAQTTI